MVCRCSSPEEHNRRASQQVASDARHTREIHEKEITALKSKIAGLTPDNTRYEILEVAATHGNLVLRLMYMSCDKCSFEGEKIIVFLGVNAIDVLRWRRIDPHFRRGEDATKRNVAPPPAARFPATVDGWADALTYAETKSE